MCVRESVCVKDEEIRRSAAPTLAQPSEALSLKFSHWYMYTKFMKAWDE